MRDKRARRRELILGAIEAFVSGLVSKKKRASARYRQEGQQRCGALSMVRRVCVEIRLEIWIEVKSIVQSSSSVLKRAPPPNISGRFARFDCQGAVTPAKKGQVALEGCATTLRATGELESVGQSELSKMMGQLRPKWLGNLSFTRNNLHVKHIVAGLRSVRPAGARSQCGPAREHVLLFSKNFSLVRGNANGASLLESRSARSYLSLLCPSLRSLAT